ncbi:hypothetical protein V8B97DRAFT_1206461 [Scleroderma yunnanense]
MNLLHPYKAMTRPSTSKLVQIIMAALIPLLRVMLHEQSGDTHSTDIALTQRTATKVTSSDFCTLQRTKKHIYEGHDCEPEFDGQDKQSVGVYCWSCPGLESVASSTNLFGPKGTRRRSVQSGLRCIQGCRYVWVERFWIITRGARVWALSQLTKDSNMHYLIEGMSLMQIPGLRFRLVDYLCRESPTKLYIQGKISSSYLTPKFSALGFPVLYTRFKTLIC